MRALQQLFSFSILISLIVGMSACSSTYHSGTEAKPDDVYYSSGDPSSPPPAVSHSTPSRSSSTDSEQPQSSGNNSGYSTAPAQNDYYSEQHKDSEGNNITNNYYNGDYYDYSYSARLRRFYSPMNDFGYYDPYYTNRYWYDYSPSSWGMSIYLGYNFWAPSFYYYDPFFFSPHVGFGVSFGYGYPFYDPWYSPMYSPYYGGGYGYGYYHGYWDGYYSALYGGYQNPYYYNSFEGTGYHYGPRGSISSNGKIVTPRTVGNSQSIGEKYQRAVTEHQVPDLSAGSVRGFTSPTAKPTTPANLSSGAPKVTPRTGGGTVSGVTDKPVTTESINKGGSIRDPKTGAVETSPLTKPSRGIISDKNEQGGGRTPVNTITSKPLRGGEVSPVAPPFQHSSGNQPSIQGGQVRPKIDQLHSRPQILNSTPPKELNDVKGQSFGAGGDIRPKIEQQPSRNNQFSQPQSQPNNPNQGVRPRNHQFSMPENEERNYERPRQYRNQQPKIERTEPKIEPRSAPKVEPRSEPKQYSAPQPRGLSAPDRGNNSGNDGNKGFSSPRRK